MSAVNISAVGRKFFFAIKLNTWKEFQKKMINWSVLRNYLNVKLVPKLKTNKLLKLLLANMKANSSIFLRLGMAGIAQNK